MEEVSAEGFMPGKTSSTWSGKHKKRSIEIKQLNNIIIQKAVCRLYDLAIRGYQYFRVVMCVSELYCLFANAVFTEVTIS